MNSSVPPAERRRCASTRLVTGDHNRLGRLHKVGIFVEMNHKRLTAALTCHFVTRCPCDWVTWFSAARVLCKRETVLARESCTKLALRPSHSPHWTSGPQRADTGRPERERQPRAEPLRTPSRRLSPSAHMHSMPPARRDAHVRPQPRACACGIFTLEVQSD